ncbi:hypothetical protein [Labilibaculum sp.]|uniref:hypothetical protein n=1 Tax=Labilibaculum sp. TaxID=2060723 RepID=UPI002AA8634E|nr:hypothetical protein [Labilibaculum sp.]MBN2597863.1 hypothetical protein [Marinifilaceae bacterium]
MTDNDCFSKILNIQQQCFTVEFTAFKKCKINTYTLVSGGDEESRDPNSCILEGRNDEGSWNVIDSQCDIEFSGRNQKPQSGEYKFYMSSNDGCKLMIDGEEQFESDGRKLHAFGQQTSLQLAKGFHKIQMGFYQCSDNIDLVVEWEGPGLLRQIIPKGVFMHQTN